MKKTKSNKNELVKKHVNNDIFNTKKLHDLTPTSGELVREGVNNGVAYIYRNHITTQV